MCLQQLGWALGHCSSMFVFPLWASIPSSAMEKTARLYSVPARGLPGQDLAEEEQLEQRSCMAPLLSAKPQSGNSWYVLLQVRTASQAAAVRPSATPSSAPATWLCGSVTLTSASPAGLLSTGTARWSPARTAASSEASKRYQQQCGRGCLRAELIHSCCCGGEQLPCSCQSARVWKRSCSALGLCSTYSGIGILDVKIRRWELHEEW